MPTHPEIPPPLEMECLRILWQLGEGSAKQVRATLTREKQLAYTTVLTLLERLVKRAVVSRRKVGRLFLYRPLLDRETARTIAVEQLLHNYFDRDRAILLRWLQEPANSTPVVEEETEGLDATLL